MEQNASPTSTITEIDLREVVQTLWASKLLIIIVTVIVTCIAAAYAFLSRPVYETEVQTLPPTPSGLSSYNMANQLSGAAIAAITGNRNPDPVSGLTPDDAYKIFLRHLNSVSLRQDFFKNTYLPAQPDAESNAAQQRLWKRFNKELVIELPTTEADNNLTQLTLDGSDPKTISDWANKYTEMAIERAQKQLLETLTSAIQLRRQSTEDQITTLRQIAKSDRQNQIARLEDALSLADSISLKDPPNTGNLITSFTGPTLYLRGSKALQAELHLLEKRVSDDPYIPELPDLLKKQALLKNIDLNPQHLSVATIDQIAVVPEEPIKPKKALILILGLILGGILGMLIVLIQQMFKQR